MKKRRFLILIVMLGLALTVTSGCSGDSGTDTAEKSSPPAVENSTSETHDETAKVENNTSESSESDTSEADIQSGNNLPVPEWLPYWIPLTEEANIWTIQKDADGTLTIGYSAPQNTQAVYEFYLNLFEGESSLSHGIYNEAAILEFTRDEYKVTIAIDPIEGEYESGVYIVLEIL